MEKHELRSHPRTFVGAGEESLPAGLALLGDARVSELLCMLADHGMSYEEFAKLPQPQGLTVRQTWDALAAIRRRMGVYYRDTCRMEGHEVAQWYFPTRRIDALLANLSSRTQVGSALDVALHERHGRRFIVRSLIEETSAALACDGLPVDYETVRGIVSGDALPVGPQERLVANTHALLSDIVDAEAPQITPDVIRAMYDRLVEGVDASALGGGIPWGMEWPDDPMSPEQVFDEICGMAAGTLADAAEHPIIVGQELTCKVWKYPPFPACNYILGSLLTRLYMKRAGFPVFAYIPSSKMALAWKSGGFSCAGVTSYQLCCEATPYDRDWTVYWESCLTLLVRELDELERYVLALKASDDVLLEHVRADHGFNHRQREVLCRAVLVPETTFRIGEHRRAFDLAYSTARQDLLTLAEGGLMEMRYESKAQVFVARRDLKAVLARRYGADE